MSQQAARAIVPSGAAVYEERVAIILGITTAALVVLIFVTCRLFINLASRTGIKNIAKNRVYHFVARYHATYWWILGVALVSHIIMGVGHTGLPARGDPDAGVHWTILGLGFGALTGATATFFSCKISPRLFTTRRSQSLLANDKYMNFYRLHSYYWWVLLLFAAAHFAVVFHHVGIWPR